MLPSAQTSSVRVPDPTYLDANPLIYWAAGRAGSGELRDVAGCRNLDALFSSKAPLAVSPITLAEFSNGVFKLVRRETQAHAFFANDHAVAAEQALMDLLASGRIKGRNLGARAFEVGMSLVATATREHGRSVYTWDAIHMYEACRWARELDKPVVIATADSDFLAICEIWPAFTRFVVLQDLSV
jgi:hypothetical protein